MGLARRSSSWLLLIVALVHLGYEPLAYALWPADPVAAGKALYYIGRGFEGTAVWCVLLAVDRTTIRSPVLAAACVWGAAENAQSAACRLALPIAGGAPVAPAFGGLCDLVAGVPVAAVTALGMLVLLSIVQEAHRAERG